MSKKNDAYMRDSSSLSIAFHFKPTRGESDKEKAADLMSAALSVVLFALRLQMQDEDGTVSPDCLQTGLEILQETAAIVAAVPFSNAPVSLAMASQFADALLRDRLPSG